MQDLEQRIISVESELIKEKASRGVLEAKITTIAETVAKIDRKMDENRGYSESGHKDIYRHIDDKIKELDSKWSDQFSQIRLLIFRIIWGALVISLICIGGLIGSLWWGVNQRIEVNTADRFKSGDHKKHLEREKELYEGYNEVLKGIMERLGK